MRPDPETARVIAICLTVVLIGFAAEIGLLIAKLAALTEEVKFLRAYFDGRCDDLCGDLARDRAAERIPEFYTEGQHDDWWN